MMIKRIPQIVIDTNVFYGALLSPLGASYLLLSLCGQGYFDIHVSVPLVLEYEGTAKLQLPSLPITARDIDVLIDYICSIATPHEIFFLWRPFLSDPKDEMVLELAVTAKCDAIVTFNKRDFRGCEKFGIRLLTPVELLREIGVAK